VSIVFRSDMDSSLTALEYCINQFNKAPNYSDILKLLISAEDADRLQKSIYWLIFVTWHYRSGACATAVSLCWHCSLYFRTPPLDTDVCYGYSCHTNYSTEWCVLFHIFCAYTSVLYAVGWASAYKVVVVVVVVAAAAAAENLWCMQVCGSSLDVYHRCW